MTLVDLDLEDSDQWYRNIDLNEILDIDDEDAETGQPDVRERPN